MPPLHEDAIRDGIVRAARSMKLSGLSPGRSGNISVRFKKGMLITASGIAPENLEPATGVVFVDAKGQTERRSKLPSTEWHFHHAIYTARPDMGAIVHCHSRYATALACLHKPIPAFHYMVAKAGGAGIPLAPYATFGTPDLAVHAARALAAREACLLANHGQIAIGATLEAAFELAEEVETLAAQYVAALTVGAPELLDDAEMMRVCEKFSTYGKQPSVPEKQRKADK